MTTEDRIKTVVGAGLALAEAKRGGWDDFSPGFEIVEMEDPEGSEITIHMDCGTLRDDGTVGGYCNFTPSGEWVPAWRWQFDEIREHDDAVFHQLTATPELTDEVVEWIADVTSRWDEIEAEMQAWED